MMNERIKLPINERIKLPPQDWLGYDPERGDIHGYTFEQMREFADLIIRECVSTLHDMHLWQSVNNQNYPSAWHDAVDQGIDAIKQHFGVDNK